ncbi:MAG: acetate kinase [Phycisphaerae bacterium]
MKVFVVNCGSSSIKYQLFSMTHEKVLAKGVLERVGTAEANLKHTTDDEETFEKNVSAPNHTEGLKIIIEALADEQMGVISSIEEIEGVGHRVVHGGENITASCRIDRKVLDVIRGNFELAPLHNPPNLAGIEAAMTSMPDVPHVAVFDTAFLSSLPQRAYRYAVPDEWYTEYHVRKYGFHGTSHRYVTQATAEMLGKSLDQVNLITCHLGNGCSMTAVRGGRAIDHSMGMTPLEGLVMGTRSGDIDPAIIFYMMNHGKLTVAEVDKALNKRSGLIGLSGVSNDMRDILTSRENGNRRAELAVEIFVYRLIRYIGSYSIILPELDAIVLTGGVGENSRFVRWRLLEQLGKLGVVGDMDRNERVIRGKSGPITTDDSQLPVLIVPTNEELTIARDTRDLVAGKKPAAG